MKMSRIEKWVAVAVLIAMATLAVAQQVAIKDATTQVTAPVTSDGIKVQQGGTWTVQPGNTANTTAWKVDGSAVTQPVSGTVTAQTQGQGSSGQTAIIVADTSAAVAIAAPGVSQIFAANGSTSWYINGYAITVATTANSAQTWQIVYGTGTNCATGQTVMTGAYTGATATGANTSPTVYFAGGGLGMIARTPASQAVCIKTTGSQSVAGLVTATNF